MHPTSSKAPVADGETLIKTVYEALTSNTDVWNETLLLIVFDEHGGFYDSVMPPARLPEGANGKPAPWPEMPPNDDNGQVTGYDFMNYGVRVPAIVISAWHPKYVDTTTVFEHSSIPKTVEALFGLPKTSGAVTSDRPDLPRQLEPLDQPRSRPIELPDPYTTGERCGSGS